MAAHATPSLRDRRAPRGNARPGHGGSSWPAAPEPFASAPRPPIEPFPPLLALRSRAPSIQPTKPAQASPLATRAPTRPPVRGRFGALARSIGERLGAWVTDLEYRLRVSRPFTFGRGSGRVFYPGCSLTAADPELVMRAFEWLRARDPSVSLWSDCCGMPLEKFASPGAAERGRERTRRLLADHGTREIITACGNCTVQLDSLEVPGLRLTSLYGLLAEEDWGARPIGDPAVVHHPCSARIDRSQQAHFRALAGRLHLQIVNVDDPKHPLACCLVTSPAAKAKRAALAGSRLVTYCAHCTMAFQGDLPTRHVLQETFGAPGDRWRPRGKVGRFAQYLRFARIALRDLAARAASPLQDRALPPPTTAPRAVTIVRSRGDTP